MMDLAHFEALPHVRRSDISRRQGIPLDYLDQIMLRLRAGGLVASIRGRGGGYRLARNSAAINLWDVFSVVEDGIYPVECLSQEDRCLFEAGCISHSAWTDIFLAMRRSLESMSLAVITKRWGDEHRMCPVAGIRECRGGSTGVSTAFG